jgi:hypothetical protein
MQSKKFAVLLGVLLLLGWANGQESESSDPRVSEDAQTGATPQVEAYQKAVVDDFCFQWRTDEEDMLHVILSAPTRGWVSVGFAATNVHKDANIIIGFLKGGEVHIQDNFGTGMFTHASDTLLGGADDVANQAGTEADGVTTISFSIPLDSGDEFDRSLEAGGTCNLIFASGPTDDFTSIHRKAASMEIEAL